VIVTVRLCTPAETRALRQAVLRPHLTLDEVAAEETDLAPGVGVFDETGRCVACAGVRHEAPDGVDDAATWRLRGMASDPSVRGLGYGSLALRSAEDHVRASGGTSMWCNARLSAQGFYERHGWEAYGAVFDLPPIGPHVKMRRTL
jgi:GNAT superfamily N-acetyltransferase